MKYRILKNNDHYVVQAKRWGMWWYQSRPSIYYNYIRYELFRSCIGKSYHFDGIEEAKKSIEVSKKDYKEKQKKKSEYEVVNTIEDTPLYKAVNGVDSEV